VPILPPLPFLLPALLVPSPPSAQAAERVERAETGHVYFKTSTALTLFDAEAWARAAGGTLVSITSKDEEVFLLENFGGSDGFWLGLEYPREVWSTGEPVSYAHWRNAEPDGGPIEPFTLLNCSEPGQWCDTNGDVDTDRYAAIFEFERGAAPPVLPAPPEVRRANRGVLLLAIQALTAKDLENPRLANLNALWKRSAWTADAGGDESRAALANLELLAWGVGSAKSQLATSKGARTATENLLTRLERTHPAITTAALFDDAATCGTVMDGRVDLRASNASPRRGGTTSPLKDALARPTPACLVVHWSAGEASEGVRTKDLAAIDGELGALLEMLRQRTTFGAEQWWIALCGLEPRATKASAKLDPEEARARTAVPLCLVVDSLPPGELLEDVNLADLAPSALAFLGVAPRRCWGLDGRVLALERAPRWDTNLVINGDAEAQFGSLATEPVALSGWRRLAGFRTARHGPEGRLAGDPGATQRGLSSFQGADGARMEQTLDLGAYASEIDRDGARAHLGVLFGVEKPARAELGVTLLFLSERLKELGRVELALSPLSKKDPPPRPAGWQAQTTDARVPRRTRAARLVLTASGADAAQTRIDELELVLKRE
jgi:hypothetical protein